MFCVLLASTSALVYQLNQLRANVPAPRFEVGNIFPVSIRTIVREHFSIFLRFTFFFGMFCVQLASTSV